MNQHKSDKDFIKMTEKKILIIDYEDISVNNLSSFLKNKGYQVFLARDGPTGLKLFKIESPDLIILEPMLPELDGLDFYKRLRENEGERIPLIIVTGFYREDEDKKEVIHSFKASAFFTKPFRKEEILFRIEQLLGGEKKNKVQEKNDKSEEISEKFLFNKGEDNFPSISSYDASPRGIKKSTLTRSVDELLKETLLEFGITLEKNKQPPQDGQDGKELQGEIKSQESSPLSQKLEQIESFVDECLAGQEVKDLKEEIELEEEKNRKLFAKLKGMRIPSLQILIPFMLASLVAIGATILLLMPRNGANLGKGRTNPLIAEKKALSETQSQKIISAIPIEEKEIKEPQSSTLLSSPQIKEKEEEALSEKREKNNLSSPGSTPQRKDTSVLIQSITVQPEPKYIEPEIEEMSPDLELEEIIGKEKITPEEGDVLQPKINEMENLEQEKPSPPSSQGEEETQIGEIFALNQVDTLPEVIKRVDPVYPPLALSKGIEDEVLVNALISENGNVIKAKIIRKANKALGFNEASIEAVLQWKFKPATKAGVRVKVWKPILISFKKE